MTAGAQGVVAGIDSSTQSCKVVTVEIESGLLRSSRTVPHPEGTDVDPESWWSALRSAAEFRLDHVEAVAVSAQQHSTIPLDESGEPLGTAILWNDHRATQAARALIAEFSRERWAKDVGVVPTAALPVAKLRWYRDHQPDLASQISTVLVPHDWLTWKLGDRQSEPATDRSDASGTGYWSARQAEYRADIIEMALGHSIQAPRVLEPHATAGATPRGALIGAGCGDNAAALLGLDVRAGEAVVSIGTSMTVSTQTDHPVEDPTGHVASLSSATGRYMPIVATLNGARTLAATARLLRVGLEEFDALAAAAAPQAGGLTFLPYLDGERTPSLPDARGALLGLTRAGLTAENVARSAVLGLACAIADAIDDLVNAGVAIDAVTLVGGGAQSSALRTAVADLCRRSVQWPTPREYAAIGAARQAAWALTGSIPEWPRPPVSTIEPSTGDSWVTEVRSRYARARLSLHGPESQD